MIQSGPVPSIQEDPPFFGKRYDAYLLGIPWRGLLRNALFLYYNNVG